MNTERIILLVEDNSADEALTIRVLKKNNVLNPVVVVHDGAEAIDYLFAKGAHSDRRELPDLILLDLKLPKMDGLDVLRVIRANDLTKRLPVVVLTSSHEEQDLIRGHGLETSYITKPVDFSQLIEVVREQGLYWLVLSQGSSPTSTEYRSKNERQ